MRRVVIDCVDFERQVNGYLERRLSVEQLRAFSFHASDCEDCWSYLQSYTIVVSLLREEGYSRSQ